MPSPHEDGDRQEETHVYTEGRCQEWSADLRDLSVSGSSRIQSEICRAIPKTSLNPLHLFSN